MNEEIKKISEEMDVVGQEAELEAIVQDNSIQFDFDSVCYRVRKPTLRENSTLNYHRLQKYNEMLKDENYQLESQLKAVYKKKGVDLNKLDIKLVEMQRKEDDMLKKLAKQTIQTEIDKLKDTVIEIRENKNELYAQKQEMLQYSLETQLANYMNEYMLSLILEKQNGKEWEIVFKTYEDFLDKSDSNLLIRATYFLSLLVYKNVL